LKRIVSGYWKCRFLLRGRRFGLRQAIGILIVIEAVELIKG